MLSYIPSWIDDCYTLLAKVNKCIEKTEEVLSTLNGKQDKLTITQLSAVNSGITQEKVEHYDTIPVVVGNPTGSGTTNLTKLKVGNTIYLVPEGTEVEANPTGSGGTDLTAINIDGQRYLIPQGTEVHGNPTETGEELILYRLKIGNTHYEILQPTLVIANPTQSPTDILTKINIGGTIFSIPSGGGTELFLHQISTIDEINVPLKFNIITDSATPLTPNDFISSSSTARAQLFLLTIEVAGFNYGIIKSATVVNNKLRIDFFDFVNGGTSSFDILSTASFTDDVLLI